MMPQGSRPAVVPTLPERGLLLALKHSFAGFLAVMITRLRPPDPERQTRKFKVTTWHMETLERAAR